ncbi:MAG: ornithine carbamoyltransferase [Gammaproteobacteria bacterium]|nr:MAG: ornithine carbamoyltransferase [Gammaproteobacteria bacterium]
MTPVRHFLTLSDCTPAELDAIITRAIELKRLLREGVTHETLHNRILAMVFEKASTRTRVSFEVGMAQLGGQSLFLSPRDTQLGRGEPVSDSARVLSSMVDIIMVRTFEHSIIDDFARYSSVPVINGLTDECHPCQLLADVQTFVEQRGSIRGKTVAWVGDCNNMCRTYINGTRAFGYTLKLSCPKGYGPDKSLLANNPAMQLADTPADAVRDADLVVTDVWFSMGQESERGQRLPLFTGFQVNPMLMNLAKPDALFMHCLPAHRGEEVSHDMLDDPRSAVWDEAENRLHTQKALMEFLLASGPFKTR